METDLTTNPAPPSGVIPTEVPLGITSTTVPVPGPSDLQITKLECFELIRPIFHSIFTIDNTQGVGTMLFKYESLYPLGNFPNRYNQIAGSNDTSRPLVPWMLVTPYFSKLSKVDFDIHLLPVKVGDSRVSLDLIALYDEIVGGNPVYGTLLTNNDSFHKILDSQDDELVVSVPNYWVSKFVQTDSTYVNIDGTQTILQPGLLPTTQLLTYIRSPYHNNMIQPIRFSIVVTVVPKTLVALMIAGKSNVTAVFPELWSQTPSPWFLHSSVN